MLLPKAITAILVNFCFQIHLVSAISSTSIFIMPLAFHLLFVCCLFVCLSIYLDYQKFSLITQTYSSHFSSHLIYNRSILNKSTLFFSFTIYFPKKTSLYIYRDKSQQIHIIYTHILIYFDRNKLFSIFLPKNLLCSSK
jgi:hypothetical protein